MKRTGNRFNTCSGNLLILYSFNHLANFRTSARNVHNICNGFFLSPLHLKKQFEYVTHAADLTNTVRANLAIQIGEPIPVLKDIHEFLILQFF